MEVEEQLNEKISAQENFTRQTLGDLRRMHEATMQDNKSFKKFIVTEYIEFFKNKKKIRLEWASYAKDTEARMDEYLKMLKSFRENITNLNTVLPILVELSSLVSKFNHEDISARQQLNAKLRLAELPNSGFLRMDQSNK